MLELLINEQGDGLGIKPLRTGKWNRKMLVGGLDEVDDGGWGEEEVNLAISASSRIGMECDNKAEGNVSHLGYVNSMDSHCLAVCYRGCGEFSK